MRNASTDSQAPFVVSETRLERLMRTGAAQPRFLQGVYPFAGKGYTELTLLNHDLCYEVPRGRTAEVIYFRAGNLTDLLIYLTLSANGRPIRYFPVGPGHEIHIPLAIVEAHPAGTELEVCVAGPSGLVGTVVIDVGVIEVAEGP